MYLDFFGLNAEPFGLSPNLRLLFPSRAHEETMAHLAYGLERGEEIILITGAIGIGKTLAIQSLIDQVADRFNCVVVNTTTVTFREFLKLVLSDLGRPCDPQSDTADLISALKSFVTSKDNQDRRLLLVVDEGQNLQPDVLESMRLLLNVVPGSTRNPVIVLAGQPGLEHTIDRPELRQLRQRIRIHYRMEPLTQDETQAFIRHRLARCGVSEPLFSRDAVEAIHQYSGGVPRLVNHLADRALLSAFVEGKKKVTKAHVDISDLPPLDQPVVRHRPELGAGEASGVLIDDRQNRRGAAQPEPKVRRKLGWVPLIAVVAAVGIALAGYLFWPSLRTMIAGTESSRAVATGAARETLVDQSARTSDGADDARQEMNQASEASELAAVRRDVPASAGSAEESDLAQESADPVTAAPEVRLPSDADAIPVTTEPHFEERAVVGAEVEEPDFGIHIASFRTMDKAENCINEMGGRGVAAVLRLHAVNGVDWKRVVVGPVRGRAQAESLAVAMRSSGLITYAQIVPW